MYSQVSNLLCAVPQTMGLLGKKAREGTIGIDDMAGGTFTISNGGVYGSLLSTPIINPPQVRTGPPAAAAAAAKITAIAAKRQTQRDLMDGRRWKSAPDEQYGICLCGCRLSGASTRSIQVSPPLPRLATLATEPITVWEAPCTTKASITTTVLLFRSLPAQSAILGMHAIVERPVAVKGKVEIRPMMNVALTYDHRLIDGREVRHV